MVLLWLVQSGRAQDPLVLNRDVASTNVAAHLSVLHDSSRAMTFKEARQAATEGRFRNNEQAWPRFGYTANAIWVHFTVRSDDDHPREWLVELRTARMDELDWYFVRGEGKIDHISGGNLRPHVCTLLDNKFPVLPLALEPGEQVDIYLRVQSQPSVHLPLKIWSPVAFAGVQARSEAVFTLFFGYMGALILMSFILSLFTKDRGFMIYSFSLVGLIANYFINCGYYAWFHFPAVRFAVHGGIMLACEFTLILLLIYLRYFFDIRTGAPKLDRRVIRPLFWATIVFAAVAVAGPFRVMIQLLQFQCLLLGAFSMGVALMFWRRGNQVARFYFLGWMAFWVLLAWSVLQFRGMVPIPALPEYPAIIGIAVSMTLFFLALADRVTQMRRDAEAMQRRAGEELRAQVSARTEQLRQQEQLIRDLHDGIGGITANIGLMASLALRDAPEKKAGLLSGIAELATEGSAEIRSLMNTLESQDMVWPDLVVECRRYGEMVLSPHGIAFDLQVEGDAELPGPGMSPGMSLFRVFKETLANVVKHAQANRVDVRMSFLPDQFRLVVADNGKGMEAGKSPGRGLSNIRKRIHGMSGRVTETAGPGTTLIFEVPLPIKSPERGMPEPGGEAVR